MELSDLKRKRGAVKHKLTSFITYFNPIKTLFESGQQLEEKCIIELQLRRSKLEEYLREFEGLQDEIEVKCSQENLNDQYTERDNFTDVFMGVLTEVRQVLKNNVEFNEFCDDRNSTGSRNSVRSSRNSRVGNEIVRSEENLNMYDLNGIKLPPIKCPTFNCELEKWLEFKDTFEALFDKNPSLSEIQMYHYLRSCLGEEALRIIQSLEFSAKNYKDAWALLCNRFDNSRLLVNSHLKSLFELNTLTRESSVDKGTVREWEHKRSDKHIPNLQEFFEFLTNRASFMETLEINSRIKDIKVKEVKKVRSNVSLLSKNSTIKCNFCKLDHSIYKCDKFMKLSIPDRWNKARELHLCTNCLCTGHFIKLCRSRPCKYCSVRHNALLHYNRENQSAPVEENINKGEASLSTSLITLTSNCSENYVLLSTALVNVCDKLGKIHLVHAILDSGSQSSFISQRLSEQLNLNLQDAKMSVTGINNATSFLKYKSSVEIKSPHNNFSSKLTCFVLPNITDNVPTYNFDITGLNIPTDTVLANPTFNISKPIDLLIGSDLFWNIICDGRIYLGKNQPVLHNTVFGYIISGPIAQPMKNSKCHFSLQQDLEKFWSLEETNIKLCNMSQDEITCENYFKDSVSRDASGKFIVRLPLKFDPSKLGNAKDMAIKRMLNLERRFEKNSEFKNNYTLFMNEYVELGHMAIVENDNKFRYFLPHHGVQKEDSLTTKLRVVFDGSAKGSGGRSLNDILYTGPSIQNDIFGILLRFRQHRFVVISDIAKMYRQIEVHPEDRYLQNIVWRSNAKNELRIFELLTVTYGTSCAPYLAIRCIKQLAIENETTFPEAANLIAKDFYVDDLITGFEGINIAIKTCNEISMIMKSASFELRKWVSNNKMILESFKNTSDQFAILDLGQDDRVKTLGIQWSNYTDTLSYSISNMSPNEPVTKRVLLSAITRIFGPLGLLSPCIIVVKIMLQELWANKSDWDEKIPLSLEAKWFKFQRDLNEFNDFKVDRHVICSDGETLELHGFSDASKQAYSATIYVRSTDKFGKVYVRLFCAKTRVAPVKLLTIPRLELCGALLLARLMSAVTASLTVQCKAYFWCDSQIVLCWLNTYSRKLQVFVRNRVAEIQQSTIIEYWSYVCSKQNPADVASRGIYPHELTTCSIWWNGPSFLYDVPRWPIKFKSATREIPELRKTSNSLLVIKSEMSDIFYKYSRLQTLIKVIAYCVRFSHNLKNKGDKKLGPLTVEELDDSTLRLIKLAQMDSFAEEISILKNSKDLTIKHRLMSLAPFLDEYNNLRVGGRLKHSSLSYDNKYPFLLDGKHKFCKLIFEHENLRLQHPGSQLLLATVRQKYWPTGGMTVAKTTVKRCITCFRIKPRRIIAKMSDLPKHRVNVSPPFFATGVGYAGPVTLRDRKGKPYKTYKSYICLFICFATKAIHTELVTDLSTPGFLTAFRRFASRRGAPAHLYSDNGSNFVGAQRELKELFNVLKESNDDIVRACARESITWHFIPPNSPNFGGLWESHIKSVKQHLIRVAGNSILTYEEFSTLLIQVEGTLNSRPLHQLSPDPNDFSYLTPAHFLIGRPLTSAPDPSFAEGVPVNRLTRFQLLQQLNQSFWKRWSRIYLSDLQKRSKWKKGDANLKLGMLVVIQNNNLPPAKWLLGRITALYPGTDGVVRVVSVKTVNGTLKRGVSKIYPLPIPEDN